VTATLQWFGCTTFRLKTHGLTLFFDTYLDRPPGLPSVGLSAAEVTDADYVFVSHAHFDHMLGADVIAPATGALVVWSYETARILRANNVADEQILPVSGGEPVDCGHGVTVRALPSLHSCLFATSPGGDSATECVGDLGVSAQERRASVNRMMGLIPSASPELATFFADVDPHCSHHDGVQLAYLVTTPDGAILVSSSSGYWTGIVGDLRPDVAILALAGRPNVNGEPYQGSLARYLLDEVALVKPGRVVFSHHDALLPPFMPEIDTGEAEALLRSEADYATHLPMTYNEPVTIL
jgi:L-ascorbate metabolism protein UlaG (beta-lactamase superfamily)